MTRAEDDLTARAVEAGIGTDGTPAGPKARQTVFQSAEPRPEEPAEPSALEDLLLAGVAPPRETWGRIFASGQLAAGRYRIERFIARGAMGEVYEAYDPELRERVALKTVRPEIAAAPQMLERFRREVHLARRVTHPNVCRLFDLNHHVEPPGPETAEPRPPLLFLTMELLSGETLAERLRRDGPMGMEEALCLARQMAAGLQAAHDAGVVHRDFKSGNVMLVPAGSGLRAVITDFGMATAVAADESERAPLTGPGALVGTPAYMAPEQVEGAEVGRAADLYALGVVLYEMVTGQRPFSGDTMMSMMLRRLSQPAPSPRIHVPSLATNWETSILRCLERDPAERFASASDLIRALEGEEVAPSRRRRRRQTLLVCLAAVCLLGSGAALYWAGSEAVAPDRPASTALHPRRSIAVLGFKNLVNRPEADWLAAALAELLATELAAGEGLRIVAGENVARVKLELGLEESDSLSAETLARLRRNLDADFVLLGSYLALGPVASGKIRLDLRIQDATAGETLARLSEEGTEAELLELVSRLGARLRERLGVGALSETEVGSLRAARPRNPEAARLYAAGVAKLRLPDAFAARDLLVQAISADPDFALSQSALSAAWQSLGYDSKAQVAAQRAFELSAALPREERLSVEARYREAMQQWDRSVEIGKELHRLFPDDVEHGLRLAEAQVSAGHGRDALATLDALRALPEPVRSDPRIDLTESAAAASLSDFRRQLAAAGRAVAEGTARGAHLLVAQAHLAEWWAHRNLGELELAVAAASEARRIYAEAEHRSGVARALNALATVLSDLGNIDAAYATDMESLEIFREIGDQRRVAWALNNLARGLRSRGRLALARQRYQESLSICREIGDKSGLGRALANTGRVLWEEGRLGEAKAMFEESLALRREIGEKRGVAGATFDLGLVLWRQGRLAEARARCEEALALFREVGDRQSASYVMSYLGDVLAAQGDLEAARKLHEEALSIRTELGLKRLVSASRLSLAGLLLEQGRFADAEGLVREILEQKPASMSGTDEALARALLARSLMAQGRPDGAKEAAESALAQVQGCELVAERLVVEIAACRVRAASAEPAESARLAARLQASESEAARLGLSGIALEARLARGEVELQSGETQQGRTTLELLRTAAAAGGFELLAARAMAALR